MQTEIKKTADGSFTLFVPELNEHYHSINGAVQESEFVFIQRGLARLDIPEIHILEVGFGTGLNALLTLLHTGSSKKIFYSGIEKYPLTWEQVSHMEYHSFLRLDESEYLNFKKMHEPVWGEIVPVTDHFMLRKEKIGLKEYTSPEQFDLVYFDAFAPDVQPAMWEEDIFASLYSRMRQEAILVTYCAKGEVRRRMERSGFLTERLPGPPGKREMLRAIKKQA
jgi:tRNA U34 5-methylaminomethyl-2-thiouridine-forming methyltransferase MnmC